MAFLLDYFLHCFPLNLLSWFHCSNNNYLCYYCCSQCSLETPLSYMRSLKHKTSNLGLQRSSLNLNSIIKALFWLSLAQEHDCTKSFQCWIRLVRHYVFFWWCRYYFQLYLSFPTLEMMISYFYIFHLLSSSFSWEQELLFFLHSIENLWVQ